MKLKKFSVLTLLLVAGLASATSYNFRLPSKGLTVAAAPAVPPTVAWGTPDNPGITVGADGLTLTYPATNYGSVIVNAAGKKTTGKWYWELTPTGNVKNVILGLSNVSYMAGVYPQDDTGTGGSMCGPGYCNAAATPGFTYASGNTIGVAYDAAALSFQVYRNNVPLNQPISMSGYPGSYGPALKVWNTMSGPLTVVANFGSKPFVYTPPTGYTKLEP